MLLLITTKNLQIFLYNEWEYKVPILSFIFQCKLPCYYSLFAVRLLSTVKVKWEKNNLFRKYFKIKLNLYQCNGQRNSVTGGLYRQAGGWDCLVLLYSRSLLELPCPHQARLIVASDVARGAAVLYIFCQTSVF